MHRPRARYLTILLVALGLSVGCTIEVPSVTMATFDFPTRTTEPAAGPVGPIPIDITDATLMARLGVSAPEEIHWLRKLPEVDMAGTTPEVVMDEHDLMASAMAELPPQLSVRPRLIIRSANPPTAEYADPFAVARGPDIWVFDETFRSLGDDLGRLTMARVLAHEFTHVAQFIALDPVVVGEVAAGRSSDLSLSHSLLVQDFVAASGWEIDSSAESGWTLTGAAATEYGATSPIEDMAEAVALVVTGSGDLVPVTHLRWVEEWLGAPERLLAAGKPWVPVGSIEVMSDTPLHDIERVEELAGDRVVEVLTFQLPATAPPASELARGVGLRLTERQLPGTLGRVDDPDILRYAGRFDRADGTIFWVELWDFREAPGYTNTPDGPALSYVMIYP